MTATIGCNNPAPETRKTPETPAVFTEIASQAGIYFAHDNGARQEVAVRNIGAGQQLHETNGIVD